MTRKFAWVLLIGLILASGFGVAKAESQDVIVRVSTDKSSYGWGENVIVTVSVTNTGPSTLYFTFATSFQAGYSIYNKKLELVWTTLNDLYLQIVTYLTLQPGETKNYTFLWQQTSETPVEIKPGTYLVRGYFEGTRTWSAPAYFDIRGRGYGAR